MELYTKIIKELKDLLFLLRFLNFKVLYKYFNHKYIIFLNAKYYDKNFLKNDNLKSSNKWFTYNLLGWLFIFDKKLPHF